MDKKETLRKYLYRLKDELLEELADLKHNPASDVGILEMENEQIIVDAAKLVVIKDIIAFCEERKRY